MTEVSPKINTLGIGLFVTATVLSLSVVSFGTEVKAVGATYYVDIQNPACNNNGPGSQAAPWCSLNKAVVTLNAGDAAYIAPGQYNIATGGYLEDIGVPGNGTVSGLHPTNAGTALNPINLIAQTTAADIIGDGNAPSAQDDAHQAFITNGLFLVDQSHWHIQGFYIKESGQLMSANNSGFSIKDSLLFVEPPNGNLGLGGGSKLSLYNSDQAVVDHVEAWSLYLRAYGSGEYPNGRCNQADGAGALNISYSSYVTVRNSFLYGAENVHYFSGSDNVMFENNYFMNGGHLGGAVTNTGNARDWIYRNNVFVGPGQEGPFVRPWCSSSGTITNGQIYNNLDIFVEGIRLETGTSPAPPFCGNSLASNILIRNDLVIAAKGANACFSNWPPDVNVLDSDHNVCIYKIDNGAQNKYWNIDLTSTYFNLLQWQTQTQYPQTRQDPNSQFLYNADPGYNTPLSQLGTYDNMVDCGTYLPSFCNPGHYSNCAPPYRMKLLDDFTVKSTSLTRSGGDPAYEGGRIGPFSYSEAVNQSPVLTPIGPQSVNENQALSVILTATDADAGDTLSFGGVNLPSGASLTDHGDRTASFAWTPSYTQAGSYATVQFSVTDGTDTDSETITITVTNVNRTVVLAPIGNKTIDEADIFSFIVTATDPDTDDALTLSASNLPSGAVFVDNGNRTGTFSWTPNTNQAGMYNNVHFEVSDGTATDSEDITITVLDGLAACTPNWTCTGWSVCSEELQTRTCTDQNSCGTDTGKPNENQACDSTAPGGITDLRVE